MKLTHLFIGVLSFLLLTEIAGGQTSNNLILFAKGLARPVCIANAGDSRLFVVSEQGYISIIDSDGTVITKPFLDLRDRVVYGGERGLLGLAFNPEYKSNGYFYVNYIGAGDSTHISRFSVNSDNPDVADSTSEQKLLTIYQPYTNHNGGDLNFGPDGYLYIGLGDGGSGGDPGNRAQNLMDFHGKILRIDINSGNPYSIPISNPFYNDSTALPEIWAYGLRNPWRFSFDRLTGDLWIADVGQDSIEEIDFQPADSPGGINYGWRCYEGNLEYNTSKCNPEDSVTFPIYTYPHGEECSITGGYVYRGSDKSPFYGYYFFADYCSNRIWTLHNESGNWVKEDFGQFPGNRFSTFGEDANGRLYIAGIGSEKIFRIDDLSTGVSPQKNGSEVKIIQEPYSNKFRIETNNSKSTKVVINLFDIQGINIYRTITRESDIELNFNFLPAGIYFLSIEFDGKSYSRKLLLGT